MEPMRDPNKPYPFDYILGATVLKLIPRRVRPNHVTVLRMLATPFVVWIIAAGNYRWGIPLFLLTAFTDAVDGAMARLRKQVTEWGTIYDPVADKLLIGSLVFVVVLKYIHPFVGIALLVVEAAFIVGGYVSLKRGTLKPANIWGKIKMGLEVTGVTLLLVAIASGLDVILHISIGAFILALAFAIVSLVTHGI